MARQQGMPAPVIEADFSRGFIRDEPRSSIPPSGLYDAADFLLDRPGLAYKRGGTTYAGPLFASGAYAWLVMYAAFPTGAKLFAITDNSQVFDVSDSGSVLVGTVNSAFLNREKPKLRVDTVVLCANDGVTQPKKAYVNASGDLTIAALGGSPPTGRYSEVYSTRIALANIDGNENRIFFSNTPLIEDTWDTTNSWLDADYAVTGLASLQGGLLSFSKGYMEVFTGTTPPPTTDMSRRTVAAVGLEDARSIAKYNGNVIFANTRGVYITNGAAPESLTKRSDGTGISSYWQELFQGYDPDTWCVTGEVFRDYYFVSVIDNLGNTPTNLILHLPSQSWGRIVNWGVMSHSASVGIDEELYFASRYEPAVHKASGIFSPTADNAEDADGTAVEPQLQYRMTGDGPGLKSYGFGRMTYDMRDPSTTDPTLTVSVAKGIEAATFTDVATLAETSDATRKRFMLGKDSQALNIKIVQSGASSKTELYSLESDVRPYPFTHDGV